MEISKEEYWSGLPFPLPGNLSNPEIEPRSSALWADSLLSQFSSVQSLSHVQFFVTPWTAARQASLSISNGRSLLKLRQTQPILRKRVLPFTILMHLNALENPENY